MQYQQNKPRSKRRASVQSAPDTAQTERSARVERCTDKAVDEPYRPRRGTGATALRRLDPLPDALCRRPKKLAGVPQGKPDLPGQDASHLGV